MLDAFGAAGFAITASIVSVLALGLPIYAGVKAAEHYNSKPAGWIAGVLALLLALLVFGPVINLLGGDQG